MVGGPYRRFLLALVASGAGILTLIVMLNVAVDAYGFWGTPGIRGLTSDKPVERDNEMLYKAAAVARRRPQTVILGSSRSDLALDPDHPGLQGNGTAYNLALLGGYMEATLDYYKYLLSLQPAVSRVLLEVNFSIFRDKFVPPPTFIPDRLTHSIYVPDIISSTLTSDALFASTRTIANNLGRSDFRSFSPAGLDFDDDMRSLAEARGMPERIRESVQLYSTYYGADFAVSTKAMANLREIVSISRARGIDLRVFIPPEHIAILEALRLSGRWCSWENWKADLAELTPFVDFSGVNAISTENVDPNMKLFWDGVHIRKPVGDLIVDRLMGVNTNTIPEGFGNTVTAETLAAWNQQQRALEKQWRDAHPALMNWIAQAVHSVGAPQSVGPFEPSACTRQQPIPVSGRSAPQLDLNGLQRTKS